MWCRRIVSSLLVAASAGFLAQPSHAQLSGELAAWVDGPVRFLLTSEEKAEWRKVTDDEAAQRFIELFWARRDPDLSTPGNQARDRFEQLVQTADEQFGNDRHRGALTDRARVLLLLGPPHFVERRGPTETVQRMSGSTGGSGFGSDEVRANADMWAYDPQRLPDTLKVKGSRLLFVFYEERPETNEFTLDRSHPNAPQALGVLGRAPETLVLHPELTAVPLPVSVVGATAADPGQLAWLDLDGTPWGERLRTVAGSAMADLERSALWLHLELPPDAPVLDRLAGRVVDAEGAPVSTFQLPAVARTTLGGRAYQLAFPLDPGRYVVEIAGAAEGQVQVVASIAAEVAAVPKDGPWFAPLWIGLEVLREEQATFGDPFSFGGWRLLPLSGGPVRRSSELSYFGYVLRPTPAADGAARMSASITVRKDGTRLGAPLQLDLPTAPLAEGLHVYANSLTLAGLPGPGRYELRFVINDPGGAARVTQTVELDVID